MSAMRPSSSTNPRCSDELRPPYTDEYFMRQALAEAALAYEAGEVPIGAVVVCRGQIIARAHNEVERLSDPTAHAEVLAVTAATEYMGSKFLPDCQLYVTVEPCVMCAGALFWARLGKLFMVQERRSSATDTMRPTSSPVVPRYVEDCLPTRRAS